MTGTTTKENPNIISVADAGPSLKRISIEIPAETVTEKLTASFDTLSVEAALPGFRKGKVPRQLIEKRFGPNLREETKGQLVASAYSEAVEGHKLRVIGEPVAEGIEKLSLETGKPFKFELEVEVLPEFEVPSAEGMSILRPTLEVTDEMVGKELEKFCINEGELDPQEVASKGDYVTGHAVMTDAEGTEHYNIDGAVIRVPTDADKGEGMMLGLRIADLGPQVGLPKPGDEITVKARGPEQHEVEALRNKDVSIKYKIQRIDRIVPAQAEKVAEGFGFETVDDLKKTIRERLEQRVQVEQRVAMRQQVANTLVEKTSIDLPARITASQAKRWIEQRRLELMYRGVDAEKIEEVTADLRNASGDAAKRELKLFFVLAKLADDMKINVNEGEINSRIAQMAWERRVRPEQLRQELIRTRQVNNIYQQIREHKTLDALIEKTKVEDVPPDEFKRRLSANA